MTTKITEQNISNIANASVQWQAIHVADGSTALSVTKGNGYFIDTTSAAQTINLPVSGNTSGDTIWIKDYAGTFNTNNVSTNTNLFDGTSGTITLNNIGASCCFVYMNSTRGWTMINNENINLASYVSATGGTVKTSGNFKTHIFTGDGDFIVSDSGSPLGNAKIDYMVVAGGGAGGVGHGGGAGAGGFRMSDSFSSTGMHPIVSPTGGLTLPATTYPITVGGGGSGGAPSTIGPGNIRWGNRGSNSVFSTITSAGGGGGVYGGQGSIDVDSKDGGSGGGVEPSTCSHKGAGNTPPVSPPQGNPGGKGQGGNPGYRNGGGGGAGAAGQDATNPKSGDGGVGAYVPDGWIGGCAPSYGTSGPVSSTRYFAGGGGGGNYSPQNPSSNGGAGGAGGGSQGKNEGQSSVSASDNTGGGGGGGGTVNPTGMAAGGKGIVMIRYKFQ